MFPKPKGSGLGTQTASFSPKSRADSHLGSGECSINSRVTANLAIGKRNRDLNPFQGITRLEVRGGQN